jgi:hypothetical protein
MSNLYTERKFSGSTTAGCSIDMVGSAIDAYAHHVLVDSGGVLLLTDLQGMSRKCYTELGLITPSPGVVGPNQSVILFDPQAQSWVDFSGFTLQSDNCLGQTGPRHWILGPRIGGNHGLEKGTQMQWVLHQTQIERCCQSCQSWPAPDWLFADPLNIYLFRVNVVVIYTLS